LYDECVNSEWLGQTTMMLFLNKKDLFHQKFSVDRIPLNISGNFPTAPTNQDDEKGALEWIQREFTKRRVKYYMPTYSHIVCCTDPENIKSVFRNDMLQGRVAFITGGGSGICKGITKYLMLHGCDTVIFARKKERLFAAAKELEQQTGKKCFPVIGDVRDPKSVEAAVDTALAQFGKIDILVNGAAGNFLAKADKISANGFKTVIEIDLIGTFITSQTVYKKYMKAHGGNIVNLSMTLHWTGNPLQVHAGAAKSGIDAMTRHLAVEWALDNVRVNAIAIGPIKDTEGFERLLPDKQIKRYTDSIPAGRFGTISDIAYSTLYLVSDIASYVTGTILTVDGGSWMTSGGLFYPQIVQSKL